VLNGLLAARPNSNRAAHAALKLWQLGNLSLLERAIGTLIGLQQLGAAETAFDLKCQWEKSSFHLSQ
jgi:hypothetical protein